MTDTWQQRMYDSNVTMHADRLHDALARIRDLTDWALRELDAGRLTTAAGNVQQLAAQAVEARGNAEAVAVLTEMKPIIEPEKEA